MRGFGDTGRMLAYETFDLTPSHRDGSEGVARIV
jgi:hypothetical protein